MNNTTSWILGIIVIAAIAYGAYSFGTNVPDGTDATNTSDTIQQTDDVKDDDVALEGMNTYSNSRYGYAMDYPDDYYWNAMFAESNYSERNSAGILVGGDFALSSEPFPGIESMCGMEPTSAECTRQNKPNDYFGANIYVLKVSVTDSLKQAITSVTDFINWDKDISSSRTFEVEDITGLARLYRPVYYDEENERFGDVVDIPVPREEHDAAVDLQVKYAPTYFFKVNEKLFVIDTAGFDRNLIEDVVKTFRVG